MRAIGCLISGISVPWTCADVGRVVTSIELRMYHLYVIPDARACLSRVSHVLCVADVIVIGTRHRKTTAPRT